MRELLAHWIPPPLPAAVGEVRMAILAYCYGGFVELAHRNPAGLLDQFRERASASLRIRVAEAGRVRAGVTVEPRVLVGLVHGHVRYLGNASRMVVLDFPRLGGSFTARGAQAVCPSHVVAVVSPGGERPSRVLVMERTGLRERLLTVAADGARHDLGLPAGRGRMGLLKLAEALR